MKFSGLVLKLLVFFLTIGGVKGQYFLQFTAADDGKPIADLSVHLTYLPSSKGPVYRFYVTDQLGMVEVKDSGTYFLQVNFLGYRSIKDTIFIHHPKNAPFKTQLELSSSVGEVVVTGEFEIKTTDQSLNKVTVIDRKRIERQGAVTLKDLLSNELNIRLNTDPVLGTSLSMQGISGQNIKILIDGVPVIGRNDGNLDLSQINLANIERVEIIEGPMSVMYGTDALGGVINLITKKSTRHTFEFATSEYYESNATYNGDLRASFKKKAWNGQLSLGRNFFQGVSIGDEVRSKTWKPREQYFADYILGVKIKNSLHRIQGSFFNERLISRGEPVFTPYSIYAFDQYFYTRRNNIALFSDFKRNANTSFNFINSYSSFRRVKTTYRKDLVKLEQIVTGSFDDQDTALFDLFMFRGVMTHRFGKILAVQTGYDINMEIGRGEKLEGGRQYINDYAAFTSFEYQPHKRVNIKPAVRFIYNSRYGAPVVPSLNFKFDFLANLALRASYARGFRAPSLKELNLLFVDVNHNIRGNTELDAEKSDNYNLSVTFLPKWRKWNFKFEQSFYHNRIYQMISLAVVNPQIQLYQYVNIDHFRSQGASFTAEARKEGFVVNAGYALLGRYNNFNNLNHVNFNYSPEYRLNGTYSIPRIFVDLSVFYKFTGSTVGFALDENSNLNQTKVDGYQTMDITLSKNFWKRRISIVAGAKNILNVTNINYSGAASGGGAHSGGGSSLPVNMGRTYFVNLRLNLIYMK